MRVKRTNVGGKVVGEENPSLARFRARELAGPGFGKDRRGVHLEKNRGFFNAHGIRCRSLDEAARSFR
jgi:hypothetical protein